MLHFFLKALTFVSVLAVRGSPVAPHDLGWHFVEAGSSGLVALESMIISPTLALLFNKVQDVPLTISGRAAHGALWDLKTNEVTALEVQSDSFCASGGFISNGTMVSFILHILMCQLKIPVQVSIGGNPTTDSGVVWDGRMGLRLLEPCLDPHGVDCVLFDDPEVVHLAVTRWYPASVRIFDGSLVFSSLSSPMSSS